ncbi:fatty acyl-CoA reductase 2, chloroplastic-like [Mercurialis annua]|uniref:fatty acyl-CoA reductase 2, chloroplastic-like n=1 Tax=Mercurialis annua TaxID=3986 RepID=UPI002160E504|nr:fatty acyl-CoA reductase 2, chloroplastic-like [Mercurialis annua]
MGTLLLNCSNLQLKPNKNITVCKNNSHSHTPKNKFLNVVNCQINVSCNSSLKCIGEFDRTRINGGHENVVMKNDDHEGIGIVNFLQGKTLFITGATGFLAKVLVEKILSSVPDIGKIYLMIRAKTQEAAMERLKSEIIDAEIFKCLKEKYGKGYEDFVLSKLFPVVGNVGELGLGLEESMANLVAKEAHVIVNSAANTTFYERYDVSVDINTRGIYHLIDFAKTCNNLRLFLQISTAYVNGTRKGQIMETIFKTGDGIIDQNYNLSTALNIESEMQLAFHAREAFNHNSSSQNLNKLGLQRAKECGWHDTYTFTKAMGEMILSEVPLPLPVVIIRPTIIESTYKHPFSGWIQGNRMLDPIINHYAKRQLTCFMGDPNCVVDVVPVDMVVNATLAAMARHGRAREANVSVYQVASSMNNPLTLQQFVTLFYEHFKSSPFFDSKGKPINAAKPMKLYASMDKFSSHLERDIKEFSNSKNSEIFAKRFMEQVRQLATLYTPYFFNEARFDSSNLQKLMEEMSEEEKVEFGFDVASIHWDYYIKEVHVPGLRRHVIGLAKERKLVS